MASNSGFPSLTALLGLLAIAGYQNRDKIGELLRGVNANREPQDSPTSRGLGGVLADVQNIGTGGLLSGGLSELVKKLQHGGLGSEADSWVKTGPNKPTSTESLGTALGPDTLGELEEKTGLSRAEILNRLARDLPDAVDKYTPDGKLPQS